MSLVTDADLEKLLASLHRMEIKGKTHLSAAVNVAMVCSLCNICSLSDRLKSFYQYLTLDDVFFGCYVSFSLP